MRTSSRSRRSCSGYRGRREIPVRDPRPERGAIAGRSRRRHREERRRGRDPRDRRPDRLRIPASPARAANRSARRPRRWRRGFSTATTPASDRRLSLQRSYAPQEVADAFRDVQRAGADAQSTVNDANAYKNQVTQQALGQASQIKNQAEGYRAEKIAIARATRNGSSRSMSSTRRIPTLPRAGSIWRRWKSIMGNMNKVLIDTGARRRRRGAVPAARPAVDASRRRRAAGAAAVRNARSSHRPAARLPARGAPTDEPHRSISVIVAVVAAGAWPIPRRSSCTSRRTRSSSGSAS